MNISRSAALVGNVFGSLPGLLPTLQAATLGGLLALGAASTASASVVLSPFANTAIPATIDGLYINVVTGVNSSSASAVTGWDINPWGSSSLYVYGPTTGYGADLSATGQVANLALGTVVGASTPLFGNGQATTTAASSPWVLNATDYFGFKFIGDDTLVHYGYGSMIVGAALTTRSIGNLWYESSANTAITVGGTTAAVPEASSGAMLLAGGGALLALALRRRRQSGV